MPLFRSHLHVVMPSALCISQLQQPVALQVFVTTTHLAIVMEYAGGGELFTRVAAPPRHHLTESEARTFFRELLAGVEYCHSVVSASRPLIRKLRRTGRTAVAMLQCHRAGAAAWPRRPRGLAGPELPRGGMTGTSGISMFHAHCVRLCCTLVFA